MKRNLMKKAFAYMLALTIAAGISGCGSSDESLSAQAPAPESKAETTAPESNTEENAETTTTTTSEAPDEPAEESAATEAEPEPEPEQEPEPEPKVDIKAMLEGYDNAIMTFDANTDLSALFLPGETGGAEDIVMPEFRIEEIDGIPMIKVYTDEMKEISWFRTNWNTDEEELVTVVAPLNMMFKINRQAVGAPDDAIIRYHFLIKGKEGELGYVDINNSAYSEYNFFYYGNSENGYGTRALKSHPDSPDEDELLITNYDNYDLYITHIDIYSEN